MTQLLMLIPKMLRRVDDSDRAREQAVFASWFVAVGSHIRRVTNPVKLERKTLIVAVSDANWRIQLKSISGELLFKLNSMLGAPLVTSIDYIVNAALIPAEIDSPRAIEFVSPERQAEPLREAAGTISNQEVRDAFLRAAGKCLERRAQ
jgi:predicted nucleic acid-binding Zn ribbon protein